MTTPQTTHPNFADIAQAAARIADICVRTPLLESPALNAALGGRLLLKAESLQTTGSFKLRGAANRILALSAEERARGFVARSSGNHGLAVAYCAKLVGLDAVVVAPETAPAAKLDRIRAYGARVVAAPMHAIAAVAAEIVERERRIFVPPADDPFIVAGQGTVGVEIVEDTRRLGVTLDALLVCCSGGGLTAGCAVALGTLSPTTRLLAVEAVGFDKMARSLAAGRRIDLPPAGQTICDAIAGPYTAAIPFAILKPRLAGTIAVSDDEALAAMRIAFSEFGLAVEPGGAVALAAVLGRKQDIAGKTVAVTITGHNVDPALASRALCAA